MPIPVSDAFRQAMNAPVRVLSARLVLHPSQDPADDIELSDGDYIISMKLEEEGAYLRECAKKLTLRLKVPENSEYGIAEGLPVSASFGAQIAGGGIEWCEWGDFTIDSIKEDEAKRIYEVSCSDQILSATDHKFEVGQISYPCTIAELARQVATIMDLPLDTNVDELPNAGFMLNDDIFEKITDTSYRQILAEIAGATGTMAYVGRGDNSLDFFPVPTDYSEPDDELDENSMRQYKIGRSWGAVNTVILSRMPQNDNVFEEDLDSVVSDGRTEVKIINNQLLDERREEAAPPLLRALLGYGYTAIDTDTIGHGWHEVGDVVRITVGGRSTTTIITKVAITIGNGIKEHIVGEVPSDEGIDYSKAGGIKRTIYRTELEVDKQEQLIKSIVQRQDESDEANSNQFTQIEQSLTSIVHTIQTTGGNNLIKNSVGFAKDGEGNLTEWASSGAVGAMSSPESLSAGGISGNAITLGASSSIRQRIPVRASSETMYSVGFRVKKGRFGNARISLANGSDMFEISLPEGDADILWEEYGYVAMRPTEGYLDLIVETDAAVTELAVTDLMMNLGDMATGWQQAAGEIMNDQVVLDGNGIKVKSSVYNDYVLITPLEFAGYSDASGTLQKVFTVNRDTTQMQKLQVRDQITMFPIKMIPIKSGARSGMAFVATQEGQ